MCAHAQDHFRVTHAGKLLRPSVESQKGIKHLLPRRSGTLPWRTPRKRMTCHPRPKLDPQVAPTRLCAWKLRLWQSQPCCTKESTPYSSPAHVVGQTLPPGIRMEIVMNLCGSRPSFGRPGSRPTTCSTVQRLCTGHCFNNT